MATKDGSRSNVVSPLRFYETNGTSAMEKYKALQTEVSLINATLSPKKQESAPTREGSKSQEKRRRSQPRQENSLRNTIRQTLKNKKIDLSTVTF